jgi:hypothetical protein
MRLLSACLVLVLAGLLGGCATPESRIKQNPDMFNSFPDDVQQKVREGKVGVGFSKDMVFIALGKPDREYTRTTSGAVNQVWSYTGTYTTMERQRVSGDFRVRDSDGLYRTVRDDVWVDVQAQHEYERLRIEFQNDEVVAIEEVNR